MEIEKTRTEEKDLAQVSVFEHESSMTHMTIAIKDMLIACIVFSIAMVAAIIVFVNGYTSRTKDWLSTLATLQSGAAVTEAADGIHEQPDP